MLPKMRMRCASLLNVHSLVLQELETKPDTRAANANHGVSKALKFAYCSQAGDLLQVGVELLLAMVFGKYHQIHLMDHAQNLAMLFQAILNNQPMAVGQRPSHSLPARYGKEDWQQLLRYASDDSPTTTPLTSVSPSSGCLDEHAVLRS